MPSLASGCSSCTACASTCAVECRMIARPSSESLRTGSISSPSPTTRLRSRSSPLTRAAIADRSAPKISAKTSPTVVVSVTLRSASSSTPTRWTLTSDTVRSLRRLVAAAGTRRPVTSYVIVPSRLRALVQPGPDLVGDPGRQLQRRPAGGRLQGRVVERALLGDVLVGRDVDHRGRAALEVRPQPLPDVPVDLARTVADRDHGVPGQVVRPLALPLELLEHLDGGGAGQALPLDRDHQRVGGPHRLAPVAGPLVVAGVDHQHPVEPAEQG